MKWLEFGSLDGEAQSVGSYGVSGDDERGSVVVDAAASREGAVGSSESSTRGCDDADAP